VKPAKTMDFGTAVTEAHRLFEIWVSADKSGLDLQTILDRTQASMLHDYRYRRNHPQFAGVVREIRGQFVLLGKIRKAVA